MMTHLNFNPAQATRAKGFTLIELLVTVAIMGLITAIALPYYNDHTRRSRAAAATADLASWGLRMEQYYLDNRNYGAGGCGIPAPPTPKYTMSCATTAGGQGFTLTASAQTNNEGTYTLSEGNQRSTTMFKGAGVSKSCWLVSGNEPC